MGGAPCEVICAYGVRNGATGRRGGDIGAESQPSRPFPPQARRLCETSVRREAAGFVLETERARILGVMQMVRSARGQRGEMGTPADDLLGVAGGAAALPVIVARFPIEAGKPRHLALQRRTPSTPGKADLSYLLPAYEPAALPRAFI
jgi:hypothetical protein